MTSTVIVYDSAGGYWPEDAKYILAYCDSWGGYYKGKRYPTNLALAKAAFPDAKIIQIAVLPPSTGVVVDGYDCEPGALTVAEVCGLVNHDVVKCGRRPFIYADTSTMPAIQKMLGSEYSQVVGKVDFWLTDPDGVAEVGAGYIAKQYSWPNSHPLVEHQNYDVSVLLADAACLKKGDPNDR